MRSSLLWLCLVLIGTPLILACKDKDPTPEEDAAQSQAEFCMDVALTRRSLGVVRNATFPLNEASFKYSAQLARTDIDELAARVPEAQGGSDLLSDLRTGMAEYERLLSTPNLISVFSDLKQQARTITSDVNELGAQAGCGALLR